MATKRVRALVATNAELPVYGGIRMPNEILHALAAELRTGRLRFTYNHDAMRPVATSNFDAGVEQSDDGSLQVWAEFDIAEADWAFMSEQFERAGLRGGMFWSVTANPRLVGTTQGSAPVCVSVDAGFFDINTPGRCALGLQ